MHFALFLLPLLGSAELASYRAAANLLDRAMEARGEVTPLSMRLEGVTYQLEQSPRPEGPYLATKLDEIVFADAANGRYVHDETSSWPYFTSRTTRRVDAEQLLTIHHSRQTHETTTFGAGRIRARIMRRHPDLLLAAAARGRASLRSAGGAAFTFVSADATVIRVSLDQNRITTAEWLSYDPLLADLELRIEYGWAEGKPATFRQFENGRLVVDASYRDLRHGPQAVAPSTEVPAKYAANAPPPPAPVTLVEMGENVHLIRNAGGADYHSLLVRFSDHLVVVEAPRSAAEARQAIAAIGTRYPNLPIRKLVTTHHHYDHIGGIRAYAELGAQIVTTTGNVAYLESLFSAPHTIEPKAPVQASVVAVRSGHRLADGAAELVLFDAGPTDHVAEILVAWLPRQKVLFQGDLFRYDPAAPEPARNSAVQLAEFIEAKRIDVKTIAGVHGEPVSPAELLEAIAMRRD